VRTAWVTAVRHLGGDEVIAAAGAAELAHRYGEPHRRYHTAAHIDAVLGHCAELADELGLAEPDRALLTLAACAHDVVYAGQAGADERASAVWAQAQLIAAGVEPPAPARVAELIGLTAAHQAGADDIVGAALLDADLAILGSGLAAYRRYAEAVRQEYASVSDELWRAGRAKVLSTLLARDPLFVTEPARRRWQAAARTNLADELAGLARLAGHQPE
jgi:predicted metal-dependent HD superfamily phosphohydrolase